MHRLSARYAAVTVQRATGFGPSLWWGELRTVDGDRPVRAWHTSGGVLTEIPIYGPSQCYPVFLGTTEAAVLALLAARIDNLRRAGR